jgi:hypothetical protein
MGTLPPSQVPSFTSPRPQRSRTKRMVIGGLAAVLAAILLWSCGKGTYHSYRLANAAVDQLHQRLNQADYETIYSEATEEFRRSGSRADDIKFFEMVHQKMGTSGKKSYKGFHINWQNGRQTVNEVVNTQFALGEAQEGFIWIIEQDEARLHTYRIDSPNLH